MKKNLLLISFIILLISNTFSQEKELRPWSWFGYGGLIGVDVSNKTIIGKQEALFTDYSPSLMVGLGGIYALNQHFGIGPSVRIAKAFKANFSLGVTSIGPIFQYNFVKTTRRFSPYIFIEPNLSVVSLNRASHTVDITNTNTSITGFTIDNQVVEIAAASASSSVWGLSSGIGLDYRFAQRWRFFSELGFNRHFTGNSTSFKENFKNVSAFRYTDLVVGLRCDMVKIKQVDVNKSKVLAKISKDSLSNKGTLSIVGRLKGIQQIGDGFTVLLVNGKGEIIKQTMSDKEGYFVFSKIDKDNYDIVLENPQTNVTANAYTENDESVLILDKSELSKLNSQNSDKVKEVVIGQAFDKQTNLPLSNLQVYLVNSKNELIAQTTTDNNGFFTYKDLPPSDYKVHFSTNYPSVKSKVTFALSDADLSIIPDSIKKDSQILIHGKIESNGSAESLSQEVLLLDKNGNIVKVTKADKDGYFAFTKIPGVDYHVVINNNDHKLKVSTNYDVTDPDLFINEKELPSFKYNKLDRDTTNKSISKVLTGKVTAKNNAESVEDLSMLLIDGEGNIVEKVKTDKEGNFKFSKLSPANYHIVFEQKNTNLKAEVFMPDDNTALIISKTDLQKFNYKKLQKDTLHTNSITINGITRHAKTNEPMDDVSVLLIDENGNIIAREKTNKEGVFNFKHLESANYQIRIESNNRNVKANFQIFDDQSILSIADKVHNDKPDTLLGTIYYSKNVYLLDLSMKQNLDKLIKYVKINHKHIKIINLDAYGDDSGTDEYNLILTKRRAQAIFNYLTEKGISKKIIRLHPYGKALTIDNANSVADPALNRKTDIKVIK